MRIHQVERLHGEFKRLHGRLATELTVLPSFPEGGGIASIVGALINLMLVEGGVFTTRTEVDKKS